MNVIVREPSAPLRLFVDKLWYISADYFNQQDIGFPVLQHELIFNFSEHFSVGQANQPPVIQNAENWLSSLYTRPQRSQTWGRHETFGVFLKPWALQALTGIPASELTDQILAGNTVFRRPVDEISEQLHQIPDAHTKLTLLERFLTQRFLDKDVPAYLIYAAESLQQNRWHDGMIRELARELRISPKSLTAAFNKHIGIPPGRFLHLRLFNDVVTKLANHPRQSFTQLAQEHGFFDQAHLNHLFKSLTDLTPGEYRKQVLAGRIRPDTPCYLQAGKAQG
ncbi:helix-turn-helix domain-containing protein [Larkinella insperata]|uniref:Helix-turn-helix domain-containing protein n=1 Tax=Larkinella insperata TaxID=332158 RepID=A0ABW3Q0M9_9BACT|nr:helix-turn-helix domain-containing protein [Larkinella insperata]